MACSAWSSGVPAGITMFSIWVKERGATANRKVTSRTGQRPCFIRHLRNLRRRIVAPKGGFVQARALISLGAAQECSPVRKPGWKRKEVELRRSGRDHFQHDATSERPHRWGD